MKIGNKTFTDGTHIMAIINLTPDSFYEGSRANEKEILCRVEKAVCDGAEVIDIGGQSTRPSYTAVNEREEWSRIENSVKVVKKNFDIPLSVDTYYPYVAKNALEEGADLINDVWGLQYSKNNDMAEIIAKYRASVCIMQNQNGISSNENLWNDIFAFLDKSVKTAKDAGIKQDKILIDEKLNKYGYPLLLGTSRKSMFGGEIKDRLNPTLKSTRLAVRKNILFVRVHDVKENYEAIKSESALLGKL